MLTTASYLRSCLERIAQEPRNSSLCIGIVTAPTMSGLISRLSRFTTIIRFILIQFLQRTVVTIKQSWLFSPTTQPDKLIKILPQRPELCHSRIFIPQHREKISHPLPLVIMVHGGGFMMNRPCVDDPLARYLADNCSCYVASIDHRKAPWHRFPAGYEDIVASILTLKDEHGPIHVDVSKVVLCGHSSGGNLVLGAAQDPRLRGKLLGVMSLTPVVNLLPTEAEQMARRPDPNVPDFLQGMWHILLDLYVGTDDPKTLRDPRLSPTFFGDRANLPKHIFMLGCEHDMLCYETEIMAKKLVGKPKEELRDGWRAGSVQWKCVKGQPHGFDKFPKKNAKEEETRLRAKAAMYDDMAQWLKNVFGTA